MFPLSFYTCRSAALSIVLFVWSVLMTVGTTFAVPIASDDFNATSLNTSVWTFMNPLGDGAVSTTGAGTGNAQLRLSVPAGLSHDSWTNGNFMPRVMQAAANTDFEVEVKFDAATTRQYQMQGLLVEQDANTWLRFDFYRTGAQVKLYVVLIQQGGSTTTYANSPVPTGAPIWMQVHRQGNQWTVRYSTDGQTFTTGVIFNRVLSVSAVGIGVGNYAASGNAPAYTALVDYFFDTANPVLPEDDALSNPPTIDVWYGTNQVFGQNGKPQGWVNILGNVTAPDGVASLTYQLNSGSQHAMGLALNVRRSQSAPELEELNNSEEGDKNTLPYHRSSTEMVKVKEEEERHPIGPDYRLAQEQRDALNSTQQSQSVGRDLTAVQLSATGGAVQLSMGPDSPRLQDPGDFNADILDDDLFPGINRIVFTAVDNLGNMSTKTVTVNYIDENVWTLPYAIDWSRVTNIQDVAQVVDGFWQIEGDGVRSVLPGYDRLLAIGDLTWDDYEVTCVITMHDIDARGYLPPSNSPAVGLGVRWAGHKVINNMQPAIGVVNQYGSLGLYRFRNSGCGARLELYEDNFGFIPEPTCSPLDFEVPYMFKMRAETRPGGQFYALKVWRQGQPEPTAWDLTTIDTDRNAPLAGSVLLLSHHVDATFGDLMITPLP